MNEIFNKFNIIDDRNRELTCLVGDVMVYFNISLREHCDFVIDTFNNFYNICPRDQISWYLTETMKQFKPVTEKSYGLPKNWWKEDAPKKNLRELILKGSKSHDAVPRCGIYLSNAEREERLFNKSSNYMRFFIPGNLFECKHNEFRNFVISLCDRIPFFCGHSGYAIECNPYFSNDAGGVAYPLAMRYHGVDIATMSSGPWAVRGERIKNVGWLTLVGSELLEKIGGFDALQRRASPLLTVIKAGHGAIVQAGEKPILGDVNRCEDLSALLDAYSLLKPLQEGIEELFAPFELRDDVDEVEATDLWLHRFMREED